MAEDNHLMPGTRVRASRTANFSEYVIGIIDGFSSHRGPVDSADNSFYYVQYWQPGETVPAIMMTPFVQPDLLYDFEPVPGEVVLDQYPTGTVVIASHNADFAEAITGELSGQLMHDDQPLYVVKYHSERLRMNTSQAFRYIQMPAETDPLPGETPVVSKPQLFGLITQLENLIQNGTDSAAALRSVANLYGKPAEVLTELAALRELVQQHG